MKTYKTVLITAVVTIVVVVVVGIVLKSRTALSNEKPTEVRLEKPVEGELVEFINAPGEVKPKRNVEISAKVSSRILELPFEEGATVTKGNSAANPPVEPSVVIRLDDSDLKAALRSVQAQRDAQAAQIKVSQIDIEVKKASLDECRASLDQARRHLARQKTLIGTHDISQSVMDEAQSKVDELTARLNGLDHGLESAGQNLEVMRYHLEAADAQIEQAKENLSYTVITAPINGVITKINAEVGEMVMTGTMNNPGTVIMEIADLSEMVFETEVDESSIGRISLGQKARVRLQPWPDVEFTGRVSQIALTFARDARTSSKYYKTDIALDPDPRLTFSGMTGDADIEIARHQNVLKIPSQAVLSRNTDELPADIRESSPLVNLSKAFATVVYRCQDDKAVVTPVKIGPSDITHTVILSGLTVDDTIITGPYKVLEKIKQDQRVIDEKQARTAKDKEKNPEAEKSEKSDNKPASPN
jgi:HlyD family secretion protein